ncbi:unnamed protein product, partial [Amoebophrya sp. A25]
VDCSRNLETGEVDCSWHDISQALEAFSQALVADLEDHLPDRILEALQRLRGVGGGLLAWSGRPLASHDPEERDVASPEVSATSFAKELSGQDSCRRQQEGGEPIEPNR